MKFCGQSLQAQLCVVLKYGTWAVQCGELRQLHANLLGSTAILWQRLQAQACRVDHQRGDRIGIVHVCGCPNCVAQHLVYTDTSCKLRSSCCMV